jgi:hypothetical protein
MHMSPRRRIAATLVLANLATAGLAVAASTGEAASTVASARWTNCDHVHAYWPHGVGRRDAVDHTTGTRVTNFKHSNRLYRIAMNHNSGLDADKDKIACEAA